MPITLFVLNDFIKKDFRLAILDFGTPIREIQEITKKRNVA
jgi:hypothetical protein